MSSSNNHNFSINKYASPAQDPGSNGNNLKLKQMIPSESQASIGKNLNNIVFMQDGRTRQQKSPQNLNPLNKSIDKLI